MTRGEKFAVVGLGAIGVAGLSVWLISHSNVTIGPAAAIRSRLSGMTQNDPNSALTKLGNVLANALNKGAQKAQGGSSGKSSGGASGGGGGGSSGGNSGQGGRVTVGDPTVVNDGNVGDPSLVVSDPNSPYYDPTDPAYDPNKDSSVYDYGDETPEQGKGDPALVGSDDNGGTSEYTGNEYDYGDGDE